MHRKERAVACGSESQMHGKCESAYVPQNSKHEYRCLGHVIKNFFKVQFLEIELSINFGRK